MKIDIKEWLYSVRTKNIQRRNILCEIERVKSEIDTIRGLRIGTLDATGVKGSIMSNPTEQKAIEIVDKYDKKVDRLLYELQQLDNDVELMEKQFNCMAKAGRLSSNEKEVLRYYYFEGMSICEVAKAMNYSEVWIKRLKGRGEGKFIEIKSFM